MFTENKMKKIFLGLSMVVKLSVRTRTYIESMHSPNKDVLSKSLIFDNIGDWDFCKSHSVVMNVLAVHQHSSYLTYLVQGGGELQGHLAQAPILGEEGGGQVYSYLI
jgi:hypothetical protein